MPVTVKATMAYAVCGILQKCFAFITLPLFTRVLTVEQFGQGTVYSSWLGILIIFVTLNLPYGSFATAMMKFETRREEYIGAVEGICLTLFMVFLVIYIPFRNIFNKVLGLPTGIVITMLLEMITSTGIQFWSGKKKFEYKYKSVVIVTLINCILSPIVAYLFVMNFEQKGYAKIFGYSLVTIIIGGYIFINNIIKCRKIYSKDMWRFALGFNIPLIVYYLSQVIFNQSDKIMISHYCGEDKAGIYGVANTIGLLMTFVINIINNTYIPWFYDKLKNNKQEENKNISNMIALILAVLLLIIIWFSPEIVYVLGGKEYEDARWIVPPIAISVLLLFYSQLFINVEFYYEEKKSLVVASIGSAIINVTLNALFIPRMGFIVAGYTTMLSYVVFVLSNYFSMKKVLKKQNIDIIGYDYKSLVSILIIFIFMGLLGGFLYRYLVIRIVSVTMIIGCIVFKYRGVISRIIKITPHN